MDDGFPSIGKRQRRFPDLANLKRRGRFKGANGTKKISIIAIITLVLGMRLFFYPGFLEKMLISAKKDIFNDKEFVRILPISIAEAYNGLSDDQELPDSQIIDPMKRIGKTTFPENPGKSFLCKENKYKKTEDKKERKFELGGQDIEKLLEGYPIHEMIENISQKRIEVAAFLIGIAKKESDWGKHSPSKNGQNCYNYWGYKGSYNLTESGYSCFDSPSQAIDVVGGKIEELIGKNINTPERMVVWKCGSSCAGHEPGSVKKWISDVSRYYYQFVS